MKQIAFVLAIFFATNLFSQTDAKNLAWAYCYKVYDGDGARVIFLKEKPDTLPTSHKNADLPKGKRVKVRFVGLDAPEIKNAFVGITATQPWAIQSRDSLRSLILHKYVLVDTLPYSRKSYSYDRLLVDVYLPEQGNTLLSRLIVSKGWAWARRSPRTDKELDEVIWQVGEDAQENHKGIFSRMVNGKWAKNVLPSYWRATHKKEK